MKVNPFKCPEDTMPLESFNDNLLKEVIAQTLHGEYSNDCHSVTTTASKLQMVSKRWCKLCKEVIIEKYKGNNDTVFATVNHLETLVGSSEQTANSGNLFDSARKLQEIVKSDVLRTVEKASLDYADYSIQQIKRGQGQQIVEELNLFEDNFRQTLALFPNLQENRILTSLQTAAQNGKNSVENYDSSTLPMSMSDGLLRARTAAAFRTDEEKIDAARRACKY
ncbi:MAG: hypothetical protein K0S74_700 [Chlamydiales bacterium]|jgi:hypothetical protein|nr:hypothetical protein [Chlamydiales bacterium]